MYRGANVWLGFAAPRVATRFFAFEHCKRLLAESPSITALSISPAIANLLAGLGGGAAEGLLCQTPMQNLQVKLNDDMRSANPRYRGAIHASVSLGREFGVLSFWRATGPTVAKAACTRALRFFLFGELTAAARSRHQLPPGAPLPASESAAAGGLAGAVSVFLTHPIDTVKTNLQGLQGARYAGILDCCRQLGPRRLFSAGITPRLVRGTLENALVFTLYQKIGAWLDRTF